jgi:tetratricopeptide (TPR) repeat protein
MQMSEQQDLKWTALIFAALLLLYAGSFHPTLGQGDVPEGIVAPAPSNPRVNKKALTDARSSSPNKKPKGSSAAAANRLAIEQAINEGNEAREANNYEKAFASYRLAEKLSPKDPRAVYGLGNVYFDLECSDQASQAYNDALRLDKDFHDALIALGNLYLNKDKYEDAEAQFRAVLRTTPNDASARIGFAYLAAKKKQYNEAIGQFQTIIADTSIDSKQRGMAYLYLGNIYVAQKRWKDAASNFKKAIEHNRDLSVAYVRLGQTELLPQLSRFSLFAQQEMRIEDRQRIVKAAQSAAEYIRTAIYAHNYKHPFGNLFLAHALLNQFNYQEAFANIDEYVEKVNKLKAHSLATNCNAGFKQLYAFAYFYRALIYNQQALFEKDPLKREEYFARVSESAQKLIETRGDEPAGYLLLGQVNFERGNCSEAIPQFEKGIMYQTNKEINDSSLILLAFCYERLGHDKEAIRAYNESLRYDPDSIHSRLGLASINEKNGNFDEAIRLTREAIELTSEPTAFLYRQSALSYYSRARVKNTEADYEEAIRLLKKALDVNQSFWPAYLSLGNVYKFYKNGLYADEALANYQQAEKYAPTDATIKFEIGDLFYSVKKNYAAAINYFEEAIKLKRDYVTAYWELGLAHRDRGDDSEAIKQLKAAINLDDKYLSAYLELADIYDRQTNYDEAIKLLLKAADKLPVEYLPYKELARVYSHQEKNREAIENYEKAISLIKADEAWFRDILRCRILRLQGQYTDSIKCIQSLSVPASVAAQIPYEIGLTYIASKNKKAAFVQYEQLKLMKSGLAEHLLREINDMK